MRFTLHDALHFSESSLTTRARLHRVPQRPFTKILVFSEKTPVTTHRHGRNSVQGSLLFTRSAYPSQNVESARLLRTRATGGLAHPLRETRLDLQAKLSAEARTRLSRCSFRFSS